jgi:TolB protein
VDADGSNLRELLSQEYDSYAGYSYPTWAPDGTKLASSGRGSGPDFSELIWVVNSDGTGLLNLTARPTQCCRSDADPAWSPDGSALAFTRDDDIWVMNADGSNARNLTSSPAVDAHPAWSPDGSRLLFVSGLDGWPEDFFYEPPSQGDLYLVNRDGTGLRRLTSAEGFEMYPAWRPSPRP